MNQALEKYNTRVAVSNSLVCVGLDSDFEKLPDRFKTAAQPQFEFNKYIIDATHEFASAYKPNAAFYEARGDAGLTELKLTMDYLREHHPDIFTIYDAKRADIGNTNRGYVEAIFDWLGFDAITLHPYLGREALQPFFDRKDKVNIILCRTSNPGAGEFQDLSVKGRPLWQTVLESIASQENCMAVMGATYPEELQQARALAPNMTFLVPGIGAQGGDVAAVMAAGLDGNKAGLIINSSRGIIFAENPGAEAKNLRDEINQHR